MTEGSVLITHNHSLQPPIEERLLFDQVPPFPKEGFREECKFQSHDVGFREDCKCLAFARKP